jgi:hypothetical protein
MTLLRYWPGLPAKHKPDLYILIVRNRPLGRRLRSAGRSG